MDQDHIFTHLGENREEYFGAGAPPIVSSANFCFSTVEEMRQALIHEDRIPFYTRGYNPTTAMLQKKMAALEGTEECLVFASGSAAIAAAVMSHVTHGDHVICVQKPYSWTQKLLGQYLERFGVSSSFVDGRDLENFKSAFQSNTRMVFLESPNSWTFDLQDVPAVCAWAREKDLLTLMDNSYSTPFLYQPAKDGVDIVLHSGTKYLSGHGDAVGGILCASSAICAEVFKGSFMTLGGIISPFNSWLILRGLRTLGIRMEKVSKNTKVVTDFLAEHPKVKQLYYPYHPDHPQYELAKKQMKMGAGQFSIELATENPKKIEAFCNTLERFLMACSWGGYESLIFPAITLYDSQNYSAASVPISMIRFYIGLEEPEHLIQDLDHALAYV